MADGTRMQQRRATEAVWTTSDYVLAAGELGVTTDTGIIKIGNGTSPWSELDPAFDSQYLPILGTAANSALLGGISSAGFLKPTDAATAATADKVALRFNDGRLKAATGVSTDDVTNFAQMTAAILASYNSVMVDARQESIVRTVTSATTVAATDVNKIIMVNHSSLTAQVVVTVPTNATVAIPVGSWVDCCAMGAGGAKFSPAGGVTFRGTNNIFPGYGVVRILKIGTDEWLGIALSSQRQSRLPKIRAVRTTGTTYTASSYSFVPYDTTDANETYNPDNEWFSLPAAGLPTGRRIICNKDGEYLVHVNFNSTVTTNTFTRINIMVADNSSTGSTIVATGLGNGGVTNMSMRFRVAATQSIGVSHNPGASGGDQADGTNSLRHDMSITRIGD